MRINIWIVPLPCLRSWPLLGSCKAAMASNGGAAYGDGAAATGSLAAALGPNASATAANAVAIGSGSLANEDDSVSVGAPGKERRITNVAAGTAASDAATVGQLVDLRAQIAPQPSTASAESTASPEAAPPSSAMNSRRLIRSPRRRANAHMPDQAPTCHRSRCRLRASSRFRSSPTPRDICR
jgi:hypothetical protein